MNIYTGMKIMSFFSGRRQSELEETSEQSSAHIGFDTVLSASTSLDGTLKSEGNIRLDGKFSGKLDIIGNVLVGETAEINADIEARNISIAGAVRGNVTGNKVQLLRTGRIWGDIRSNSLTTEDGAFIEGNIAMNVVNISTQTEKEAEASEGDDTLASTEDTLKETLPDVPDGAVDNADEND